MAHLGRRSEAARESGTGSGRKTDLDRVLAGHAILTAREIIVRIHEVNPTGRMVDKREAARRYAIKTRLQSLLVQRFSDEIEVVPDAKEGVVLLRHKYLGLAASHAIVTDLDEEARAWVQMQIDLGAVEQAWTNQPEARGQAHRRRVHRNGGHDRVRTIPAGAAEMVAALDEGRMALASYDYEAARDALWHAHALAPEAPAPLAALLDLLVNQLGLDREALEVAEASESTALQSPTATAAMALAAARLGERERAETWARALDGARAAEIFRTLAAKALGAGDLALAAEAIGRARRSLPNDPDCIPIEAELERAHAAAVVEDEARLAQLVVGGDVTAAAELAHQIVHRHPGSTRARAVLKEAATRERRGRRQRFLDEARVATAQARFKQARQALASAREHGACATEVADIEQTIASAEVEAARLAHQRSLEVVAAHLSATGPERRAAIAAYLGLDREGRETVRGRCQAEELAWLDEIPPGAPATRCEPIAAAVMAARTATDLLDAGNLDGAERTLHAHRIVLGEHGFGRQVLVRFEGARQASQQAHALATLEKASAAWGAKNVDRAKELLDSIARDGLPSSSHEALDRLSRTLASARQHQAILELVDERLAKNLPIGARQLLLGQLAESRDEDEFASLRQRLAEVDAAVRKNHLGIDHVPSSCYLASEAPETINNYVFARGVETALLPGGQTLVVLSAGAGVYAARLVDVDSGEIRRLLAWSMKEAFLVQSIGIADQRLWIQDGFFHYAEICCETWLPCRQCDLRPDANPAEVLSNCVAVPGSDVAWLQTESVVPPFRSRLRPVDIAHGSVIDVWDDEGEVFSIPGSNPPLLAWFDLHQTLILVWARGDDEVFIRLPAAGTAIAVALAPDGDGYVVLCEAKDKADPWLELVLVDALGTERARVRFPGVHEGAPSVATILPRRLVCVSYQVKGSGQTRLAYVRAQSQGELAVAADVEIPGLIGIAQDPAASTAVALCRTVHGLRLARLDDMPTVFPASYDEPSIPRLVKLVDCSPPAEPELESRFRSEENSFLREDHPAYTDGKLEALAQSVHRSQQAVSTHRLLRLRDINGRADRLLDYLELQKTNNFFVRLAVAERAALAGRWVGDDLEGDAAAAGASEHLLHVHAVALLRDGRLDEVIDVLAGRAPRGPCRLDSLLALAHALKAERSGVPMTPEEAERPSLATLVRLVFAADRALARGDRGEVLRILDQGWIRYVRETQSMARLADVYLATTSDAPAIERFRAATLLAGFIQDNFRGLRNRQLWLGDSTWSRERLAKLTDDAYKWMMRFTWKPSPS